MLVTCWSAKGGVGTTTIVAGLAVRAADQSVGCLAVDLEGDLPAALGVARPAGPGLAAWLAAGADAPPDALARIEHPVGPGLHLLARGEVPEEGADGGRIALLAALLARDRRLVVVDAGRLDVHRHRAPLAASAARSLLVTRACYLALSRTSHLPAAPTGVVVVRDPARSLRSVQVEAATGTRVVAELRVDPAVGRAVDAGLLTTRLPRSFASALAAVVDLDVAVEAA